MSSAPHGVTEPSVVAPKAWRRSPSQDHPSDEDITSLRLESSRRCGPGFAHERPVASITVEQPLLGSLCCHAANAGRSNASGCPRATVGHFPTRWRPAGARIAKPGSLPAQRLCFRWPAALRWQSLRVLRFWRRAASQVQRTPTRVGCGVTHEARARSQASRVSLAGLSRARRKPPLRRSNSQAVRPLARALHLPLLPLLPLLP
jgi:hypothetical protein